MAGRIESRDAQIRNMEIGESFSLSRRLDTVFGMDRSAVVESTKQIRNVLDQCANRARKATGNSYIVENGEFVTSQSAIVICVVATRTA